MSSLTSRHRAPRAKSHGILPTSPRKQPKRQGFRLQHDSVPMRPVAVAVPQDMDNGVDVSGATMDPTTMTVPEENDSPPPPPAPLVVNPYKKLSKEQEMGGQSQRRNNQTKRAKSLAQQRSNKKRKQQEAKQLRQLTLEKKKGL